VSLEDQYKQKNSLYPDQEIESADDDSWQVSYLDIITIILGFLIILLSVSSLNDIETFSVSDLFKSSENETEFITTPIEQIKERLEALLAQEIEAGQLEIFRELNDVKIKLRSDDIYRSGSAEIQPSSKEMLNRVLAAFRLIEYDDFEIDVEGHTDNVPITTASYPSNWELSTARASNVVKYFNQMGIDEERLKASGYASSRPVIEFDDQGNPIAASRSKNRRVVLRLYYSTPEQLIAENSDSKNSESPSSDTQQNSPEEEGSEISNTTDEANTETEETAPLTENTVEDKADNKKEELAEATPSPVIKSEDISKQPRANNQLSVVDAEACSFSVEAGNYESFANSIRAANQAETATGTDFEIVYNNFLFSVRSTPQNSIRQAITLQKSAQSSISSSESASVINQCYSQPYQYPENLKYIIQLGFFSSEQNAANFRDNLNSEYNIDAKLENLSVQAHTVYAGPFVNRSAAQQRISEFREIELLNNAFIKYDQGTVSDYSYDYQILAGSYPSKTKAFQISQSLQNQYNIRSEVKTKADGYSYVITENQNDMDRALIVIDQLTGSNLDIDPVIFLTEKN